MLTYKFKKNLLVALITLAVILVAANILLQQKSSHHDNNEFTLNEMDLGERFRNILNEFGIDNKFIKETKSLDKQSDRKIASFKIQVPKDLSIPEILLDVYRSFIKDSLTINSVEKNKNGKSILNLKLGTATLLQAEFDYSKTYSRNKGILSFFIYDAKPENQSTAILIESPTKLNFLIRPDAIIHQYLEFITNNHQQYSVLIDDEISEQKYQLSPGFSEQRVITVMKTLVTDFQKSVCFIVDDNSKFFKSSNYEVLKRELLKRKIKIFTTSDFVHLNYDEFLVSVFNEEVKSLENGESLIFLLNEETYLALNPEMKKYQKKGYRVITSSLIL